MKLDQETFGKHRFWFLYSPAILILLISLLYLVVSVKGDNKTLRENLDRHKQKLQEHAADGRLSDKGGQVKFGLLVERESNLHNLRVKLWRQGWKMQKDLYTWPERLVTDLPFGANISETARGQYPEANIYAAQINELGDTFKHTVPVNGEMLKPPVAFKGDFKKVISYVKNWEHVPPSSEEVWLAQEDIWVQKELLKAVKDAIGYVAELKKVEGKAYPTKVEAREKRAHFRNAYWHLDLILADKNGKFFLRGTIKNVGRRQLQVGTIHFKLKLNSGNAEPFYLAVQSDTLFPGDEATIRETPVAGLVNPEGLLGVTQILEARDSPIKRIDQIALPYKSQRTMQPFLYPPDPKEIVELMRRVRGGPGARPGKGPRNQPPSAPPPPAKGLKIAEYTANGVPRMRYLEIVNEVRRIPFGMVLLVDQAHIPEMEAALANSKLRVQVTQVGWQHYRGGDGKDKARATAQGNVVEIAIYGIASLYKRFATDVPTE